MAKNRDVNFSGYLGERDGANLCPESPVDGLHEPDWSSVTIEEDGGEVYIDVKCRLCGRSGCIGTVKKVTQNICW